MQDGIRIQITQQEENTTKGKHQKQETDNKAQQARREGEEERARRERGQEANKDKTDIGIIHASQHSNDHEKPTPRHGQETNSKRQATHERYRTTNTKAKRKDREERTDHIQGRDKGKYKLQQVITPMSMRKQYSLLAIKNKTRTKRQLRWG